MRRQRTIFGNPDEFSSPRYGSPRHHTSSPRSINSEGTFDRSGSVMSDNAGSVMSGNSVSVMSGKTVSVMSGSGTSGSVMSGSAIGHDDPTLVHANINKGTPTSEKEEEIKSTFSGALASFLTTSFSEEESRDSNDTRRANQRPSELTLRQQLVELDQRQDAWRAKEQEASIDTDATADFYLKEVGELSSLASPRRKQFALLEETIYEEEEERENDVPEISSSKSSDHEADDSVNAMYEQPPYGKKWRMEVKTPNMLVVDRNLTDPPQQHATDDQPPSDKKSTIEVKTPNKGQSNLPVVDRNSVDPPMQRTTYDQPPSDKKSTIEVKTPTEGRSNLPVVGRDSVDPPQQRTTYDQPSSDKKSTNEVKTPKEGQPNLLVDDKNSMDPPQQRTTYDQPPSEKKSTIEVKTPKEGQPNLLVDDRNLTNYPRQPSSYGKPPSGKKSTIEVKTPKEGQSNLLVDGNLANHRRQHEPEEVDAIITPFQAQQIGQSEEDFSKRRGQKNLENRQSGESASSTDGRKTAEATGPVGMVARIKSLDSSSDESTGSEFDSENTSRDEKYVSKKNWKTYSTDGTDVDPSKRNKDCTFVDVEDDARVPNTRASVESNDTNEIIKAVQERLSFYTSTKSKNIPYATESVDASDDHQKSSKFKSWLQSSSSTHSRGESKGNAWTGPQTLASKADRSHDEDEPDVETGFREKRRNLKLFTLNSCFALAIIATIVSSIFLAVELTRSDSGDQSHVDGNIVNSTKAIESETIDFNGEFSGSNEGLLIESHSPSSFSSTPPPNEAIESEPNEVEEAESSTSEMSLEKTPTTSPTWDQTIKVSRIESLAPSSSSSTPPSDSPSKSSFGISSRITPSEILPNEKPEKQQIPTVSPTINPGSVEGKIHAISGESIYDISTPQHGAYDWLISEDPATLDLDSLTEGELSQRYIAALLYFSLDGRNWFEQYGFLTESHVCKWNNGSSRNKLGVICNSSNKITGFAINDNNSRGQLPGELTELTDLTLLQFRSNFISGTIPPGFDKLSMLEEIDFRQNELAGTMPEEIFNLPRIKRILLLRNSLLSGTIPDTIEKASHLEMLSLQKCNISGSIPSTIGNLSKMFFFTFMENKLTGSIPDSVTNLSLLEVLELSGNQLTGTIPDLANHNHLYFLSLFDNKLRGTIPESLGNLPKLMFLDIRNNQLDGSIPPSLGQLPDLVTFFAQNNQLTGNLPSFSGNTGLLQAIHLSENKLSGNLGDFFKADGPTERLVTIDLSYNDFSGSIPASVGLFESISELDLEGNSLSGTIPREIGSLKEMVTFNLGENKFSGELPEEFGFIVHLIYLNVANNQFEGTIPDTLSFLSKLKVLDMQSNHLVGSVPARFSQLSNLNELYLNDNDITGDLTEPLCRGYSFGSTFNYIEAFAADCLEPEGAVTCECCTSCCGDDNCLPQ